MGSMGMALRGEVCLLQAEDVIVLLRPEPHQAMEVRQEMPDIVGSNTQAGGEAARRGQVCRRHDSPRGWARDGHGVINALIRSSHVLVHGHTFVAGSGLVVTGLLGTGTCWSTIVP
jgi:hypothetical protein